MGVSGRSAAALPDEIRRMAARLGATGDPGLVQVRLAQRGTMWGRPEGWPMRFTARQTMELRHAEFVWQAKVGPLGAVSVRDALRDGEAQLEVRLLRRLRLAGVRGGNAAAKGEIMRYLAELAWAPDAILCNESLGWSVVDARTLRVSAGRDQARGEVELRLDEEGRIVSVCAQDRPRKEGSGFVERPWRGRFFDYRKHQGRWLPFAGQVGWVLNGQSFTAWQGELLSWAMG